MAGATRICCQRQSISVRSMYTIQPCHFMQSHIRKVYTCLAVTCHLRFWQNDRGLLHATVVTREWNGYQNKSQHRKLTLEKKILPPLQQGFKPVTFQSQVRHSNHWAIPTPTQYTLGQLSKTECGCPSGRGWWWCRASCPRMLADILGTNCDQCLSMVQCCFTGIETIRFVRTESPGRPPRLSYSSWIMMWQGN